MNCEVRKYSVLMPLYKKDNPDWLKVSIDSMLKQTIFPSEIVVIKDGPITKGLQEVLEDYTTRYPDLFVICGFDENKGLGKVLAYGVEKCRYELIARMDSDDYSEPDRCEKQLKIFEQQKDIDVVGSNVLEFIDDVNNIMANVNLPQYNNEIISYAKRRCPIRHPALMYKKDKVIQAGNYRDYRHAQDYNLVVYMILIGAKFYNIQEYLVHMRTSYDFYRRRGGMEQLKLVLRLKNEFYKIGFYSLEDFVISAGGNAIVCVMPNFIRKWFYLKTLRK